MRPLRFLGAAVIGIALVTATPARSQEAPAPRKMTLDEAVAYARAHHLRVIAAKQRLDAAQADADVPSAQWLPRIGAFAEVIGATTNNSTTTLLNVPTVDIPRVGATQVKGTYSFQPYPSTAAAIGARQQIYDFGRIAAESAAASLTAEIERVRLANATLDVDFAVEQAYYAVLAASAIEDASRNAFERASKYRDQARANVASGLRPPIEQTRAEADVARYEAGMTRARGSLHVARAVFAAATGVDDIELDVAGPAKHRGSLPALGDLIRRGERSPIVLEGRARAEAQRAQTRALDAQNRPNLYLTAAYSQRAGGALPSSGPTPYAEGWLPVVPNYDVGVVLSWQIIEPVLARRADASRAREQALASEADLALRNQRTAIAAAWQDADVAVRSLAALERGADAARANYDQAENRMRVGLGTATELADAQAVRTEAEIQLAIGRFQMARTRAALERAVAEVR
jgi:outer membrane protein